MKLHVITMNNDLVNCIKCF